MDRLLGLRRRVYGDGPMTTRTREHELLGGRVTPNSGGPDHRTPHLRWSQSRQDHRTQQRIQYACDLLLQVRIPRRVRQSPLELMGLVGPLRPSLGRRGAACEGRTTVRLRSRSEAEREHSPVGRPAGDWRWPAPSCRVSKAAIRRANASRKPSISPSEMSRLTYPY